MRLHVRAIVRDGTAAFVGSQSLRKLELDGRREVGVIIADARIAKKMQDVFEADWALTAEAKRQGGGRKTRRRRKRSENENATSAASMTPESMTVPVREIALKYISSPLISATRNARSVIEAGRRQPGALVDVPLPQLPARSGHEVDDALLRLDPLVEVIVPGKHDADAVLDEERLERVAQRQCPIRAARPMNRAGDGSRESSSPRLDACSSFSSHAICCGSR